MIKLKTLEKLLLAPQALAGQCIRFKCMACGREYLIDGRMLNLPIVTKLVPNCCPACGSDKVEATGVFVG